MVSYVGRFLCNAFSKGKTVQCKLGTKNSNAFFCEAIHALRQVLPISSFSTGAVWKTIKSNTERLFCGCMLRAVIAFFCHPCGTLELDRSEDSAEQANPNLTQPRSANPLVYSTNTFDGSVSFVYSALNN